MNFLCVCFVYLTVIETVVLLNFVNAESDTVLLLVVPETEQVLSNDRTKLLEKFNSQNPGILKERNPFMLKILSRMLEEQRRREQDNDASSRRGFSLPKANLRQLRNVNKHSRNVDWRFYPSIANE